MLLLDEGQRDKFFAGTQIFFNRYLFESWEDFIGVVVKIMSLVCKWRVAACSEEPPRKSIFKI
jgi:hypothetical protein